MQTPETLWIQLAPFISDAIHVDDLIRLEQKDLPHYLRQTLKRVLETHRITLTDETFESLVQMVLDDMLGLGPVEALMRDEAITDILINGPHEIYIERLGRLEKTTIQFRGDTHLSHVLRRSLANIGQRLDISRPYVDAILPDGSRLNAIISPIADRGPVLSIRKFHRFRFSLQALVEADSMTQEAAQYLTLAIQTHLNIMISGGTGTGITTLLNALLSSIPSHERIIAIEDTSELELSRQHAIRLVTRQPSLGETGRVTQRDLLRNALRMRPDRIIVGEIRGDEVMDMFQAMNTGHDGSLSTVHASSPREVPTRLTNMAVMMGLHLNTDFIMQQIADTIDVIVQLSRMKDGQRYVLSICELAGLSPQGILLREVYSSQGFHPDAIHRLTPEKIQRYCDPNTVPSWFRWV